MIQDQITDLKRDFSINLNEVKNTLAMPQEESNTTYHEVEVEEESRFTGAEESSEYSSKRSQKERQVYSH